MRWQVPWGDVIAGQPVRPAQRDYPVAHVIVQGKLVDADAPSRDPVGEQLGPVDHLVDGERADGQRGGGVLHGPRQRCPQAARGDQVCQMRAGTVPGSRAGPSEPCQA